MNVFVCTLCEQSWDTIPKDAVNLTPAKRGGRDHAHTYRFADGSIHIIKKLAVKTPEEKQ